MGCCLVAVQVRWYLRELWHAGQYLGVYMLTLTLSDIEWCWTISALSLPCSVLRSEKTSSQTFFSKFKGDQTIWVENLEHSVWLHNSLVSLYQLSVYSDKTLEYISILVSLLSNYIMIKTLTSGSFPQFLKVARVIPIFKAGNPNQLGNYRPISILPIFSKVFWTNSFQTAV